VVCFKIEKFLQENAVDTTKQKEDRKKKPKPEGQDGMFLGICGENSRNVFLLLFMALWVPVSATL
jgi:hypothetical protein